jgi:histidinol-phosphate aminotransferase
VPILTSMSNDFTRRELLKSSGLIVGAGVVAPQLVFAGVSKPTPSSKTESLIRLSLNENPYGSSPNVAQALQLELGRLNRYADAPLARQFAEQIAEYEHIPVEQVVLGEILDLLGLFLGSSGGPGGEFLYSTPTGTINDDEAFKSFLRETSRSAVVVVDEAYLEYTSDFGTRSAASLVREGANVVVFRTFDKIHGLAGMPIGYVLAPHWLADALRKEGAGDAEGLGRLNLVAASAGQLRCVSEVSISDARILRTPTGLGSQLVYRRRIFVLKMP